MLRKRPITSRADGHRWPIAAGWRTAGRQTSAEVIHRDLPCPVLYFAVASPRACFTIASLLHNTDVHQRIGATESGSRATGAMVSPVRAREISILRPQTEDANFNRAFGASGGRQPRQGGRPGKDAPDDGTDGSWGNVFANEDKFEGWTRDSAEAVPCPSLAMGDDRAHDIPRDSGVGDFAAPGVFFHARGPKIETSSAVRCTNDKNRWLLAGGFCDGLGVRLHTRSGHRN